jgi:predicted class III extradiol MEMO1 family dioxygenase
MTAIEQMKIRPLWAEHYPRWRQNPASKVVCLTISHTIKEQAALLTAGANWSVKLGITVLKTSSSSSLKTARSTAEALTGKYLEWAA